MYDSIEGIVLKRIPYNDKANIVYVYTQTYGFLPIMIKKTSTLKDNHAAFIIPLGIIQFDIRINPTREIQFVSNVSTEYYLLSLRENFDKLNIATFFSEFLYQILKYPHKDNNLYEFLKNFILKLDSLPVEFCSNIHLFALVKLLTFLGIEPENNFSQKNIYFDLKQACFTNQIATDFIENETVSELWNFFLSSGFESSVLKKISRLNKKSFIKSIMNYYTLHLDKKIDFTALEIIQAIYEDHPQNV
ncbi:MAG: DNA repair protein RecO [Bacteroidales bacterium]